MSDEFDEPREVEVQWTEDYARSNCNDDEDGYDEDSISNVDLEIGDSREAIEINSWDDIPDAYELANEQDADEYNNYLERKNYYDSDDE